MIKKFLFIFTYTFILTFYGSISVYAACSYTQGWDLVDGSKKVDYSGGTKYAGLPDAIYAWNKLGKVIIQKDTIWTINDLTIRDYTQANTTLGYTDSAGNIGFNTFMMDTMTSLQRRKTMMHELGHALGLDHRDTVFISVMRQGIIEMSDIGPVDQDTYYCLWN